MNDEKAVRDLLRSLLDWDNAHARFDDAVQDFPRELRGIRPDGGPHSPWELLEHLRSRSTTSSGFRATRRMSRRSSLPVSGRRRLRLRPRPHGTKASMRFALRSQFADVAGDDSVDLFANVSAWTGRPVSGDSPRRRSQRVSRRAADDGAADPRRMSTIRVMKTILILTAAVCLAACSRPATEQSTTTTAATTTATAPLPLRHRSSGGDTFAMPAKLETTPSGLKYSIDQPGTGRAPKSGQTVPVHYTGWLTDGTKFDSSRGGEPLHVPIGQGRVVKGWDGRHRRDELGEKRTLVIPSPDLGYGAAAPAPFRRTPRWSSIELVGVR